MLKMQRGDDSSAKRARVLYRNLMREIVMDSDIDKDKCYASQEWVDEEELSPPSRQSSISQLPSPDY